MLLPPSQTAVAGRPLVNVSLALNYAINDALGVDQRSDPDGPNKTVGYHVLNLLLHIACGLLLFGIIRRTIDRDRSAAANVDAQRVAGFAVLLWLVHPIQTEAVDYVIQRTELLVSLCYAGTLYASIRAWDSKKHSARWCVACVVACAFGMASKEVMITAPLVVLLYDRAFRAESWTALWQNGQRRRVLRRRSPRRVLIVVISILAGARSQSVGFGLGVPWYQYFYTQAWAIARYLRLLVWPSGLTFDYGERPVAFASSIPGLVLLAACAIGTIVAFTRKRWMWLGFVGAWFFLAAGAVVERGADQDRDRGGAANLSGERRDLRPRGDRRRAFGTPLRTRADRRARRVRRPGGGARRRHRRAGPDVPQLGDALSRRDRQGARQSAGLRRGRAGRISSAGPRRLWTRRQCFVRRSR